jgi:protein-disulfide isomerase
MFAAARKRTRSVVFALVTIGVVCGASVGLVACRQQSGAAAADPTRQTLPLLRGVPQDGITLGTAAAPATLTAYVDVTTRTELLDPATFASIMRDYVRPGRLRIQLRTVPSEDEAVTSDSGWAAARALQAAGLQNHLWDLYVVFDADYIGVLTDDDLRVMARSVPALDTPAMLRDARSERIGLAIRRAERYAQDAGLTTLPAFVVAQQDGPVQRLRGPLRRALAQVLPSI